MFRFVAGSRDAADLVECSMETLKADVSPSGSKDWTSDYLALSYAWGETQQDGSHLTHGLVCDGRWLPVTKHLWQGLQRIREFQYAWLLALRGLQKLEQTDIQYDSMSLWLDAICINQSDREEKNSQVQMMWDVYRSAATLVVRLGELDNEDESESMRVFCARPSLPGYWRERTHAAVRLLSKRSWFVRRWACQEVSATLSKYESAIVLIGEHMLKLRALTNGLKKTKRDRWDRVGPGGSL